MEGQSGLSELSAISWVSAVEGCSLSGVPLLLLLKMEYSAKHKGLPEKCQQV